MLQKATEFMQESSLKVRLGLLEGAEKLGRGRNVFPGKAIDHPEQLLPFLGEKEEHEHVEPDPNSLAKAGKERARSNCSCWQKQPRPRNFSEGKCSSSNLSAKS